MIVDNFDIIEIIALKNKANAVLLIDSNAKLTRPVTG